MVLSMPPKIIVAYAIFKEKKTLRIIESYTYLTNKTIWKLSSERIDAKCLTSWIINIKCSIGTLTHLAQTRIISLHYSFSYEHP